jgi:hypothetical protein
LPENKAKSFAATHENERLYHAVRRVKAGECGSSQVSVRLVSQIFDFIIAHAKVMSDLMDDRLADLLAQVVGVREVA